MIRADDSAALVRAVNWVRAIQSRADRDAEELGLNLEFNVELKNRSDYDFAIAKFNELWAMAVDVSKPYEDTIVNRSPFANFTPLELYLKFLYEYTTHDTPGVAAKATAAKRRRLSN